MADAEDVVAGLPDMPDVSTIGLVLNHRGLERAMATSVDEINLVISASDGFAMANQGMDTEATWSEVAAMTADVDGARPVSLTISVAFGCPFDGPTPPEKVTDLVRRAVAAGIDEVALGDTIGVATPIQVRDLVGEIVPVLGPVPLRMHFHDTRNMAVANAAAAVTMGATWLDASVGGAGGCPFAPHATGNVGTEDLAYMLGDGEIDHDKLIATARWLFGRLGRDPESGLARAGWFPATPAP